METIQNELSAHRPAAQDAAWSHLRGIPCLLSVQVSLPRFTIRRLLDLVPGVILDTYHEEGSRVPVTVNSQMIGWGEFDVVDETLAVRLTEIA
jgi:flagellar motor switch protein FliN/FliY